MKTLRSSILEPTDDGIIAQLSRKSFREGEERLLYAMLENAIEDYQKYANATNKKGRELFEQAEAWFFETDSRSEFSFENICDYLDLNACYVRKGLVRWRAQKTCASSIDQPQQEPSLQKAVNDSVSADNPKPSPPAWRNQP